MLTTWNATKIGFKGNIAFIVVAKILVLIIEQWQAKFSPSKKKIKICWLDNYYYLSSTKCLLYFPISGMVAEPHIWSIPMCQCPTCRSVLCNYMDLQEILLEMECWSKWMRFLEWGSNSEPTWDSSDRGSNRLWETLREQPGISLLRTLNIWINREFRNGLFPKLMA